MILSYLFSSPEWIIQFFMFPGMMLWPFAPGQGSDYQQRLNGNTAVEGALRTGTCCKCVPDKCLKLVFIG